ncbi:hypothetical protein SUDANB121_03532 [Nocardiopsis dassonvillei]|uniref:LxmA leader domain family RiPP n=1 Tax=Nocardiopsis dassonvillei TaxID=2014 RepID=UPI003F54CCC2
MSTESLMSGADDYTTPAEIADSAANEPPEASLAPTPTLPTTLRPTTVGTVTTLQVGC